MKNIYTLFCLFLYFIPFKGLTQEISNESSSQIMGTNQSTGSAAVSVPIYSLKDGNIVVPISLGYDASGMKPTTIASCVGTNWALNAGGRIIRMVKDKPDESFCGIDSEGFDDCGITHHYWGYKYNTVYNGISYPSFTETNNKKFYFFRDLQPDVFMLMVAGLSVQFTLVPNASGFLEPVLLNQVSDIKIEILENEYEALQTPVLPSPSFTNSLDQLIYEYPKKLRERQCGTGTSATFPFSYYKPLTAFKVTTNDGFVYYFGVDISSREYSFSMNSFEASNFLRVDGKKEKKEMHANIGTKITAPTAWLLNKIVKPKGVIKPFANFKTEDKFQEVNFTYERAAFLMDVEKSNQADIVEEGTPGTNCVSVTKGTLPYEVNNIQFQSLLKTIESDNFKIEMNASTLFAYDGKISNITAHIPTYISGDFSNAKRLDIEGLMGNTLIPDEVRPNGMLTKIDNAIKTIPKSMILKNILIIDKATQKKIGFYLDFDYFQNKNDAAAGQVFTNEQKYRINKRLKLNGVYPIEIVSASSARLNNGFQLKYDPTPTPMYNTDAVDYWGFYNGAPNKNINGLFRHLGLLTATTTCTQTTAVDRAPSLLFTKAGVLTEITLPTGASTSYDYELHSAGNYFTSKSATGVKTGFKPIGGLRVSKITSKDPFTNAEYTTRYYYKKTKLATEESSGFLSVWPESDYTTVKSVPTSQLWSGVSFADPSNAANKLIPDKNFVSANRWQELMAHFMNGGYITYKAVIEEKTAMIGGVETPNGAVLTEFNITEDEPYMILQNGQFSYDVNNPAVYGDCFNAYRYLNLGKIPKYDFLKGTTKKTSVFKNGLTLPLTTTEFQYSLNDLTTIKNVKKTILLQPTILTPNIQGVAKGNILSKFTSACHSSVYMVSGLGFVYYFSKLLDGFLNNTASYNDQSVYYLQHSFVPINSLKLTTTTTTDFDLNGINPVLTNTTLEYGSEHSQPIKSITLTNKPGGTLVSERKIEQNIRYIKDIIFGGGPYSGEVLAIKQMNDRNFNVPIETVTKRNGKVIAGSYVEFQDNINLVGLPKATYKLELSTPISTAYAMATLSGSSIVKNTNYVKSTNYTSFNTKGLNTAFNYNKGVTKQITYGYNDLLPTSITEASNVSAMAKTVSFEYDSPLFGVNKSIEPDGNFSSKEFDNLGREKLTRDRDNNILTATNYNYALKNYANTAINVKMQIKNASNIFVDATPVSNVIDGASLSVAAGQIFNFKINATVSVGSMVAAYDNQWVSFGNFSNSTNTLNLFGSSGIIPTVSSSNSGSQKIGTSYITVYLYSKPDGQGELLGYKKIRVTIN